MLRELHAKATAAGVPVTSCLSYSHFCLHDSSLVDDGTAAYMASHGVGVLNGSPLSMSLLTTAGAPAWHPARPELRARAAAAAAHAASLGFNFERLAMGFALSSEEVPTCLFSTSKLAKLQANMAQATDAAGPLTPAEAKAMAEIKERFFSGEGYAAIRSWEGVETTKVWAKIGKQLLSAWYADKGAARSSGDSSSPVASDGVAAGLVSSALAAMHAAQPSR
jgi:hypothetical protein